MTPVAATMGVGLPISSKTSSPTRRYPIGRQPPVNRAVSIGAGSWLGAGAIVLPGARIGRNVVIAAGSVVRGEVPDRCVVAGVPAKVVREHTGDGWRPPGQAPYPVG